ncbi:TPA: hypothetical protein QIF87_002204, partial [Enterobacter ludwigii]|nr:hypothetical protein [Enterobacter ludwigii]
MEKYLYLLKPSFVDNWVNGGMVPLNNAEYYRRNERKGVFTPDECVTDTSTHDFRKIPKLFEFGDDCNVSLGNFRYELMTPTGPTKEVHYTEMMTITRSFEDGLIFCACDTKSILTAKRFKKSFCV